MLLTENHFWGSILLGFQATNEVQRKVAGGKLIEEHTVINMTDDSPPPACGPEKGFGGRRESSAS